MTTFIMYAAALLPPILLLWYIYWKDPKKEPRSQLMRAFWWGVGIAIPVALTEVLIGKILFNGAEPTTLIGTTISAFFEAALPEEAAKLLVLWLVLRNNPYFDEHFDGIVYAVFVGLGFAAIENIAYVVGNEQWLTVAIARALLSVPGHYAFAVIMGYCYSLYHFVDKSRKNAFFILFMPFMAHGIYDATLMSVNANVAFALIAMPFLIYFCYKIHKIAYKRISALIEKDKTIGNAQQ